MLAPKLFPDLSFVMRIIVYDIISLITVTYVKTINSNINCLRMIYMNTYHFQTIYVPSLYMNFIIMLLFYEYFSSTLRYQC